MRHTEGAGTIAKCPSATCQHPGCLPSTLRPFSPSKPCTFFFCTESHSLLPPCCAQGRLFLAMNMSRRLKAPGHAQLSIYGLTTAVVTCKCTCGHLTHAHSSHIVIALGTSSNGSGEYSYWQYRRRKWKISILGCFQRVPNISVSSYLIHIKIG
jgi:hypothetical protein